MRLLSLRRSADIEARKIISRYQVLLSPNGSREFFFSRRGKELVRFITYNLRLHTFDATSWLKYEKISWFGTIPIKACFNKAFAASILGMFWASKTWKTIAAFELTRKILLFTRKKSSLALRSLHKKEVWENDQKRRSLRSNCTLAVSTIEGAALLFMIKYCLFRKFCLFLSLTYHMTHFNLF